MAPRDREGEKKARSRRRRRGVAIGVAVALVAAIGVGQLAFGLVTRVIDATGWTCGSGWERVDDLADMRILRWGTPEAREQGFDPADFDTLPPGLAQPTLTTLAEPPSGGYAPLLYPLDGGVVVQQSGYHDSTWVGADALTGEPLWGLASSTSGFSTVQGYFALVSAREDGRTDLTTFDARTGEELSCVRLGGDVMHIEAVGDRDLVIAFRATSDQGGYRLLRIDPTSGEIAWDQPMSIAPTAVHAGADVITVSSDQVEGIATGWPTSGDLSSQILGIDPATGEQTWERSSPEGQTAVVAMVELPDGGTAALTLDIADQQAWEESAGEYVLLDVRGEELWRIPASYGRDGIGSVTASGVVVVMEDYRPVGIDLATGERLWRAEGAGLEDDIGVLTVDGTDLVVLADQRAEGEGGETQFVTHLIDALTGELTVLDAPLRSFDVTDSYVLTSTGLTQVVVPLAES